MNLSLEMDVFVPSVTINIRPCWFLAGKLVASCKHLSHKCRHRYLFSKLCQQKERSQRLYALSGQSALNTC